MPPGESTSQSELAYALRTSGSSAWKSPQSSAVSKRRRSFARSSASATRNGTADARAAAFARARSIAEGAASIPSTRRPSDAR